MSAAPLSITFSNQSLSQEPFDALLIEQDDWKPYTGIVTKKDVVRYLASIFWPEESFNPQFDCGIVGGEMICPIYVYPYTQGLAYQFKTSYGTLSERAEDTIDVTETVNFSLDTEVTTKYPVRELKSVEWVDVVYDETGTITTAESITFENMTLTIGTPVYGSARVEYTTERHAYVLTVTPRTDVAENLFSAAVFAVYAGGIQWLEIEPPPGADEYLEGTEDCSFGWRSTGSVTYPDDSGNRPKAAYADRKIVMDYCSNTQISDDTFGRVEMGEV